MEDVRLRQLGRRLIAFYAPELLNSEEKRKFSKYICDKWSETEKAVSWTTMEQVQVDLVRLKDKGVPKEDRNCPGSSVFMKRGFSNMAVKLMIGCCALSIAGEVTALRLC